MTTAIDRLKIKGCPAPRNSPSSPLMVTTAANRPMPNTMISLDKSYEFVMRHASKNSMDIAFHMSASSRRMNYLNRLQHSNFGLTSSSEPTQLINSDEHTCDEKPNFVLCGQPVNGVSPKTLNNYFREDRVGSYKTSAHQVLRMRQKASKARSEPNSRSASEASFKDDREVKTSHGTRSKDAQNQREKNETRDPKSAKKFSGAAIKNLELEGHNFKGCSPDRLRGKHGPDYYDDLKPTKSARPSTRREATNESMRSHTAIDLQSCILVNSSTPRNQYSSRSDVESQNNQNLFVKRGTRLHNNPYRTLKSREKKLISGEKLFDLNAIKRMATSLDSPSMQTEKYVEMPKSILKVPAQCTDTFLLQMMLELNRPLSRDSKVSGKYSDIALQRDLDDYMVVRSPSSNSQARSSPVKSITQKSVKSNLDEVEEESTLIDHDLDVDL